MTTMMMMMIMTDPFTTNLVVKGPVVKGSVVKGAHPIMMLMMTMPTLESAAPPQCNAGTHLSLLLLPLDPRQRCRRLCNKEVVARPPER